MVASPDASWVLCWESDAEGRLARIDPLWREVAGQSAVEARDQGWLRAIHEDDRAAFLRALQRASAEQSPFRFEFRLKLGNGVACSRAFASAAPRFDADNTFLGLIGTVAGLPHCRMETALCEGGSLDRCALQALPAHIAVLDRNGDILVTNRAWQAFADQNEAAGKPAVAVGANYLDVCRRAASAADEDAARALAGLEAVLNGRQARFSMEYPCHSPQVQRWFYMTIAPLAAPGKGGVVVTHLDVTERKRSEAALRASETRYRTLVDATSAVTWSCPPSGLHVEPQPEWMAFTGQSFEEMMGDGWTKAVHPDDIAVAAARWHESVARGEPFTTEQRIRRHDGQWRWMDVRAVPIRDEHGDIVEWFGMNIDVTEQRQARESLGDRNRQLNLLARTSQRLLLDIRSENDLLASIFSDIADEIGVESYYHFRPIEPRLLGLSICGGVSEEEQKLFATIRFGELLCGRVAETQTCLVIEDLQHSAHPGSSMLNAAGATSYAGFPLVANGELFGTVAFISSKQTHFRDGDMQVIQSICDQIAIVLERWRLARALQQSEERLRLALEAGRLATWDWRIATGEIVWNDAHYRMLGYEPGSVKPSYRAWCDHVHPDDLRRVETALQQSIEAGCDYKEEYRALWPDGTIRFVEANGLFLRDAKGHPLRGYGVMQDITERRQAEDALRRSEERLKRVLETDAVGVMFFDREGYLVDANDVFLRTTGYTRADIEARALHWRKMTPPEYIDESLKQLEGFASTGRIGPYEKEYYLHDGSKRWMLFAGRDLGDGTVAEYCVDISKRKEMEEALHKSEQLKAFLLKLSDALRGLADPAEITVRGCRLLGEQLSVDRAYYVEINEATGVARVERDYVTGDAQSLAGEHLISDFSWSLDILRRSQCHVIADAQESPLVPPVDRPALAALQIVACMGAPLVKDGALVGALCVTSPHPRDWNPDEVALLREVGERVWASVERARAEAALHDAESRFRTMADTAPALIWETDDSGVTFVNGHYFDFFGVGFNEIAGMRWTDFLHPEDRAGYLDAYADAFEKRRFFAFDCRFRRADGEYRWMRNAGRPLNERKFVGCSIDITELKNAEEVLRESDRRKDEFLATLAHELRNPLTPIRNAAQILKKKYGPDAKDAALFDMVERQTKHLVRLVEDLLEISRISRGKIILRKENVELTMVLRDALEACRPLIASKGHQLQVHAPAEPISVSGDPVRIVQIATNLINNAAKYTLPGGAIDIDVARDGADAVFRVRDNGVGIDPKIIPRIFDVFAQTDAHSRLSEGGLGIGLAVVSKLVGLHGGSIEAHSDGLGKGSEFEVRLPLVVDATQAVTQA